MIVSNDDVKFLLNVHVDGTPQKLQIQFINTFKISELFQHLECRLRMVVDSLLDR